MYGINLLVFIIKQLYAIQNRQLLCILNYKIVKIKSSCGIKPWWFGWQVLGLLNQWPKAV
jgi:hypothetical protein